MPIESAANISEFEVFFHEHYQDLCGYAYKMLGDSHEAEDVVQLFFIKLWEDRARLNITAFKAYAYRAIRNRCLNVVMYNSKHQRESVDSMLENVLLGMDHGTDDSYAYREQVRVAIRKIPKKSRRILLMHCVLGMKYQEIADTLGVSINTVKSQIAVAYKVMREDLEYLFPLMFLFLLNN